MTAREQLLDELRPGSFAIVYRMLGSVSEAEDVVQEALLRVHQVLEAGEQIASPRAFVATVTTRLAINELRSARARRELFALYLDGQQPIGVLAARHRRRSDRQHQLDRQPRQADTPRPGRRPPIAASVSEMTVTSACAGSRGSTMCRPR